ncbi:MAG: 30S ribosomal protein S16 [Deltaproteobacteria bacterium]|nr:30S ribosomal protein S16 [Deltaproteobacteria bacterium]
MVVIRFTRAGTKKKPFFHVVVADHTRCRDGKYLERLGYYNPKAKREERLKIDLESAKAWIAKGAQPSETVGQLLAAASKSK